MRPLLLLLFLTILCTCVRAQNGPSLVAGLSYISLTPGDAFPNSQRYGDLYFKNVSGPAIGIGLAPDLANGETTGTKPILLIMLQYARLTKSETIQQSDDLILEKEFNLNLLSGLLQAGVSIPLGNKGLSAEVGAAINFFATFNERREVVRITSFQTNTADLEFSEGGSVGLGPFTGLHYQSGRYGYGLRTQYLLRPVSKRAGSYPRSFSAIEVQLMATYQISK